jgi:L-fuculose-phosphate aldolase
MTGRRAGFARERAEIVGACRKMNTLGINQGTAGNISLRVKGGLLVTPSGMPYDAMTAADIVFMKADGSVPAGQRKPSSEWRFHRDILASRPEVGAVVHSHAMFATTLSCLRRAIPAFHYMVAVAGGDSIRCAPYATFGTQALSDRAVKALAGRKACLLANHGMIAVGETLAKALALAVEVETLAAQYWRVLQAGKPVLLSKREMRVVLAKFATYGVQDMR